MSQWGAYGAAKVAKLSANQILAFYYPHTWLATRSTSRTISVLITAANAPDRGYLQVAPAAGLTITTVGGKPALLPTATAAHKAITAWRLQASGTVVKLREKAASGHWSTLKAVGAGATFSDTAGIVAVAEPGRTIRYRGVITGEMEAGSLQAVNLVNLELYLRSVVPSEMPSSWSPAALQAQAVAARTYATRGRANPKTSWFDVFGDTRDQAYGGLGSETTATNRALHTTAGEIIVDSTNHAILAQYASADGGWTVSGGEPYLPAKADPYDGAVPNNAHAWTTSVSATTLESAYPAIGTLRDIEITGRDGHGAWGGRVTSLILVGSKASATMSGTDLQLTLGLRSPWFRPTPTPAAPSGLKATATGKTVTATWKAPPPLRGAAPVTGYRFSLSPGSHRQTLTAATFKATVAKLSAGKHTVTVVALSAAGASPPATLAVTTG
jgi:stage II sporulation protein D